MRFFPKISTFIIEYIKYLRAVTTEKECEMLEIDEEYLEQCVANLVECSE